MTRYAVSLFAYRKTCGSAGCTTVEHGVGIVEAASRYEAEGVGLAIVRKLYPPGDGWEGHHVKVCSMSNVLTVESAVLTKNDV